MALSWRTTVLIYINDGFVVKSDCVVVKVVYRRFGAVSSKETGWGPRGPSSFATSPARPESSF
jgi:hypothetical protein